MLDICHALASHAIMYALVPTKVKIGCGYFILWQRGRSFLIYGIVDVQSTSCAMCVYNNNARLVRLHKTGLPVGNHQQLPTQMDP